MQVITRIREGLVTFEAFLKALPLPPDFQATIEKIIKYIETALNSFV
jgi:hypothetical protein